MCNKQRGWEKTLEQRGGSPWEQHWRHLAPSSWRPGTWWRAKDRGHPMGDTASQRQRGGEAWGGSQSLRPKVAAKGPCGRAGSESRRNCAQQNGHGSFPLSLKPHGGPHKDHRNRNATSDFSLGLCFRAPLHIVVKEICFQSLQEGNSLWPRGRWQFSGRQGPKQLDNTRK